MYIRPTVNVVIYVRIVLIHKLTKNNVFILFKSRLLFPLQKSFRETSNCMPIFYNLNNLHQFIFHSTSSHNNSVPWGISGDWWTIELHFVKIIRTIPSLVRVNKAGNYNGYDHVCIILEPPYQNYEGYLFTGYRNISNMLIHMLIFGGLGPPRSASAANHICWIRIPIDDSVKAGGIVERET